MSITYGDEKAARYAYKWIGNTPKSITQLDSSSSGVASYDYFEDTAVVNDAICWAINPTDTRHYSGIKLDIGTAVAATTFAVKWQYGTRYSAGSTTVTWKDLEEVNDESNHFQNTGTQYITWKIPTDWGNYFNPQNGEDGGADDVSGSAQWYKHYARAVIVTVTGLTEGGAQSSANTEVISNRIFADDETTLSFQDIIDADHAGVINLATRASVSAVDASPVNLFQQSTRGFKVCQGGVLADLNLTTASFTGFTSVTVQIAGLDPAGVSQTEDIVITTNGVSVLAKYWSVIKTSQTTSVTGAGSFDYTIDQTGWNVVNDGGSESSITFNADLALTGTTVLTDTEYNITFINSTAPYFRADVSFGEIFRGAYVHKGVNWIFESYNSDFSSQYIAASNASIYDSKYYVKNRSDSGITQGFWGAGLGTDAAQSIINVNAYGWRNLDMRGAGNYISGVIGAKTKNEGDGALMVGNTFFGEGKASRPVRTVLGAVVYDNDMSEADVTSTIPAVGVTLCCIQPWETNAVIGWTARYIDCNWGLYPDNQRVCWRISGTNVGIPYLYEDYTLKIKAADKNGNVLEGVTLKIKDKNNAVVATYGTNIDGYFYDDTFSITGFASDTFTDSTQSWASDEFGYKKLLVTSGIGEGYERAIYKDEGTSTTVKFAPAIPITMVSGDRVVILPSINVRRYEPSAYTASSYQFSTVVTNGPHTLEYSKSGYTTLVEEIDINKKLEKTVTLKRSILDLT